MEKNDFLDINIENISWLYEHKLDRPWKHYSLDGHSENANINYYKLLFLVSGDYEINFTDGYKTVVNQNALLLMKEYGYEHINSSIELPLHYYSILFYTKEKIDESIFDHNTRVIYPNSPNYIEKLFLKAFNSFLKQNLTWKIDVKSVILSILSEFMNQYYFKKMSRNIPSYLIEAIKIIDSNIYDNSINITELANKLNLSPNYFSSAFKQHMGTTPKRYILDKKLIFSATLLTNTDKTIAEICELSGINDPSYFNIVFKEKYGIPPGQYRKRD